MMSDNERLIDDVDDQQTQDPESPPPPPPPSPPSQSEIDYLPNNDNSTDNSLEPTKYTSQIAALLITVNVTIGAGLLAMPSVMYESGLITSMIIQILFLAAIIITCIICTELTVKSGVNSYHRVIQAHCHAYVFKFTQVSILLLVFGAMVAYIVIIGDQSDRVFLSLYGDKFCHTWYMNRRFIMIAATVFIIKPLCCAKTVDFLKYGSFAGVASLAFVMYVVVSEFIKQGNVAKDVNYVPKKWSDVGTILPVLCLAYQCHLSWVPTAATIRREDKYTTYKTITLAMILTSIIYSLVCILAVLTFGSKISDDLTESYPGKSWPILTTIAIVAFKCMVTLPPAYLPARLSMIDILSNASARFSQFSDATKRISVTFVTFNIALLFALYVPDILVAVDILGCLSVCFIFTLPGLSYLNLIKENRLMKQQLAGLDNTVPIYSSKDKLKRMISYFFIVFGLLMMIIVLYSSILKIMSPSTTNSTCVP